MKKTRDNSKTGWQRHSPEDFSAEVMSSVAYDLLCAKITLRHAEKLFEQTHIEGEYNGVDMYEALQGIHDSVSAALSYILEPEEEEYALARVEREIDRSIWKAEACYE